MFLFLSNAARKKATYDKFGEEGLKGGITSELGVNGAWSSGYVYHGNADETFRQFFGGDNPFAGYFYRMKKLYCFFFNECVSLINVNFKRQSGAINVHNVLVFLKIPALISDMS